MTNPRKAVVYRIFDDADELIYVGCSLNPLQRIGAHNYEAWWWDEMATITVTRFDSLQEARCAEAKAILLERPRRNIQGKQSSTLFERSA